MVFWFATSAILVCPFICPHAQARVSQHDCCGHKVVASHDGLRDGATHQCCVESAKVLPTSESELVQKSFALAPLSVERVVTPQVMASVYGRHLQTGPPGAKVSLYLLKSSFLI